MAKAYMHLDVDLKNEPLVKKIAAAMEPLGTVPSKALRTRARALALSPFPADIAIGETIDGLVDIVDELLNADDKETTG